MRWTERIKWNERTEVNRAQKKVDRARTKVDRGYIRGPSGKSGPSAKLHGGPCAFARSEHFALGPPYRIFFWKCANVMEAIASTMRSSKLSSMHSTRAATIVANFPPLKLRTIRPMQSVLMLKRDQASNSSEGS
jgi:hypothetical protein